MSSVQYTEVAMRLSEAAVALFRLHLDTHGQVNVESNRQAHEVMLGSRE